MSFLFISDFSILWLCVSIFNLYKEKKFLFINFENELKLLERKEKPKKNLIIGIIPKRSISFNKFTS